MANYKEVKGVTIQTRDEDPTVNAGTWASAPNLNAANREGGGSGTSTSAINVGGYPYPMTSEQWNGSSWTTFANMGTPRGKNASAGTYTNAIVGNGSTPGTPGIGKLNLVESWNGSAWSEISEINTIRDGNGFSAGGTSTDVVYFGGAVPVPSGSVTALNEKWNGSSWSEESDLNTARSYVVGMGTSTASLAVSGYPGKANSESWNGSAWTDTNALNTAREYAGGTSVSSTSGLCFGGNPQKTNTESWNGTVWTEVNDLATGRHYVKGAGPDSTSALAFGGYTTTDVANTEEWSFPSGPHLNEGDLFLSGGTTLKGFGKFAGVPTATWASVANMNVARAQPGTGAGSTSTNCLAIGGYDNPPLQYKANIENFDGSSWTELNDLSEGRQFGNGGGTRTSAIIFGGTDGSAVASTELFDGTNVSTAANLNTARYVQGGASQINTAALCFGGYTGTANTANTENWDGSSWTEVNNINNTRSYINGAGTPTNAIAISGEPTPRNYVESWDGTSWTEIAEINTARAQGGCSGFGTNTNVIFFGGEPGSNTITELWNGSSWTEIGDMGTARTTPGGAGTSIAGMAFGGNPTKSLAEEFTADNVLSTVTVS
jgi:hypothetical protein